MTHQAHKVNVSSGSNGAAVFAQRPPIQWVRGSNPELFRKCRALFNIYPLTSPGCDREFWSFCVQYLFVKAPSFEAREADRCLNNRLGIVRARG